MNKLDWGYFTFCILIFTAALLVPILLKRGLGRQSVVIFIAEPPKMEVKISCGWNHEGKSQCFLSYPINKNRVANGGNRLVGF